VLRVLRSGCYLTHDSIAYAAAFQRVLEDTTLDLPPGGLAPALEVWAYVQSRPEPGRTILTMGKRDVSFDAGMPVPLFWYRPGAMDRPEPMPRGHAVLALNDQHCHLGTPGESPLAVGDMVGFGIGHPCTTFDKWSLLMMVDSDYTVVDAVKTFF
jgi:D-serine dehydratase